MVCLELNKTGGVDGSELSAECKAFRKELARVRALMSNTHRNEALIRECSQVNVANRSEESRTSYVVERDAHWRRVKEGERDRGGTARGKSVTAALIVDAFASAASEDELTKVRERGRELESTVVVRQNEQIQRVRVAYREQSQKTRAGGFWRGTLRV